MRLHHHEQDRLDSLRSYDVLDTAPEPSFDAVVQLAARLCSAPVAGINLVDADRQWSKAGTGTPIRELARTYSICNDVVVDQARLVLPDARNDPRYADNPMVTSGGLRAYAGVPLVGRDGLPLGTLCVADTRPRRFTEEQLQGLRVLADQVMTQLELRRLDRASGRRASDLLTEARDPARLRAALDDGELEPHFQPQVDMRTGRTLGFEALLRWNHPELGLLPPAVFLPAIESSRLILPVGRHVLDQSLLLLAEIRSDPTLPRLLGMAVNVSGVQLQVPGLADVVLQSLQDSNVPAACLSVEVTETMPLLDTAIARRELVALREAGVHLALDDYGVGWSALGRLLELPITALKLDRSLVVGLPHDPRSTTVARSTFELATDMGIEVVCEGVETVEQRDALLGMGAVYGQGWLFARPMSPEAVVAHLRDQPPPVEVVPAARVPAPRAAVSSATGAGPVEAGVQTLLDALPDPAAVLDGQGRVTSVNRAWQLFATENGGDPLATGSGADYLGVCDMAAAGGSTDAAAAAAAVRAVLAGRTVERAFEYVCSTGSGDRWFLLRVTPLGGLHDGALVSHVDVTTQHLAQRGLQSLVTADPLTGLVNGLALRTRLADALAAGGGRPGRDVGVLHVRLAEVRSLADVYGRGAADDLLREVARRLRRVAREQDVVAFPGADVYVVLVTRCTGTHLASLVGVATAVLAEPHLVQGELVPVRAVVSSYLAPSGSDPDEALRRADASVRPRVTS